jgi:uncharacterized repeat protein (TIGR01451 family)
MIVLALVLVVGTGFILSGCATCCGEPAPAPRATKCAYGVQGCNKDNSALWIEKSMPEQVVVGQPFQYTIKATNLRSCPLEDVVITERASEGLTIQSGESELQIGTMQPNEVREIVLTAVANAGGSPATCTKSDYKPVLCCGTEAISPSLELALEAQAQGVLCDVIPAKVTVSNSGTGLARNAVIRLDLPGGLTTTDGQSSVAINVGDLNGGDSKAYNINLKAAEAKTYSIKANAEATGLTAASNAVSIAVTQPVLKVSIDGPSKIFVTKNATYKVSAQNSGDTDSVDTVVTASIPAGMRFVSASEGGSASGNSVVWNVGTLGAGKSVSMDAVFNAVQGGSGMSVATAKGYCCQDEANTQTDIAGIPALLLEAIDVDDPIQVGGTEKFYITVTNQGSAPDTNIVVKVSFEENFDYQSSKGPTAAVKEDAKSVEFAPLASLGAGQKATWEVIGVAKKEGDHRTSVKLTSDFLTRSVDETESTHVY